MNQTALLHHPMPSDYATAFAPDQECIDQSAAAANHHAHHSPFAAGVPDPLRRDGPYAHSSLATLVHNPGLRYIPRPEAHYPPPTAVSDSSPASVSASPGSTSSIGYSSFTSPTGAYPVGPSSCSTGPQFFANQLSSPFALPSSGRARMPSLTDSSSMLPPAPSPAMGPPVSPSGPSVRDNNYANPAGVVRSMLPQNHHPTAYASPPDPPASYSSPRSVLSNSMSLSSAVAGSYAPAHVYNYGAGTETPPFQDQENYCEVTCDGRPVTIHIEAKAEKGFFYSMDRVWTCYRRNYFAVQVSYSLEPHIPHGRLHLAHGAKEPERIQSIAVALSAVVDGAGGKSIELVRHTPKRDKAPQLPMKKEYVLPSPPTRAQPHDHHSHHNHHAGYGGMLGTYPGAAPPPTAVAAPPELPLQDDHEATRVAHAQEEQSQPPYSPTSGLSHAGATSQHTFERIQFKSATANNGKRRAQQQYYHLVVELWANVQKVRSDDPRWVKLAARSSAPVVVRGRSPSHYSNEGPHNSSLTRGPNNNGGGGGSCGGAGASNGLVGHHPSAQLYNPSAFGVATHGAPNTFGSRYANDMTPFGSNTGSLYRGSATTYSLDPSPMVSHSASSASSLSGGAVEGYVGGAVVAGAQQQHANHAQPHGLLEMEDAKHMENFDGYQYYPSPLYDAAGGATAGPNGAPTSSGGQSSQHTVQSVNTGTGPAIKSELAPPHAHAHSTPIPHTAHHSHHGVPTPAPTPSASTRAAGVAATTSSATFNMTMTSLLDSSASGTVGAGARRDKDDFAAATGGWASTCGGRFQGLESSRGYYPDLLTGGGQHGTY